MIQGILIIYGVIINSAYFCSFTYPPLPQHTHTNMHTHTHTHTHIHTQQTLFKFISRPKISSIIVTHYFPSVQHSTFCYQLLYLLIITPYIIRIPYIISIIVIPHHWCLFFSFIYPHTTHQTLFQFISRPNFSSIIVTHHPPSAQQSKFCYQIIYLLIIPPPLISIPCIRSIIVTPLHQCLLFFHLPLPHPPPPQHNRH